MVKNKIEYFSHLLSLCLYNKNIYLYNNIDNFGIRTIGTKCTGFDEQRINYGYLLVKDFYNLVEYENMKMKEIWVDPGKDLFLNPYLTLHNMFRVFEYQENILWQTTCNFRLPSLTFMDKVIKSIGLFKRLWRIKL